MMLLPDLLTSGVDVKTLRAKSTELEITGIAIDSRKVEGGYLFIAIRGAKADGHDFVSQAVEAGAVAVIASRPVDTGRAALVLVEDTSRILGILAHRFFGNPAASMHVAGITGTNGKTTVSYMVQSVLNEKGLCGRIGTIDNDLLGSKTDSVNTTPDALAIAGMCRELADNGATALAIEVSSHGLDAGRVVGMRFNTAVFTNLTAEHLDHHKTMENYLSAKCRLFEMLSDAADAENRACAVVNIDDPHSGKIMEASRPARVLTFSVSKQADITAQNIRHENHGMVFDMITPRGAVTVKLNLAGLFNVSNALAAAGTGICAGIAPEKIAKGLERVTRVPGRFEWHKVPGGPTVIIDYAHTEDALANVLENARKLCSGNLHVVFGCGGDRDTSKRETMGMVAAKMADRTVITNDNPRSEAPEKIAGAIEDGYVKTRKDSTQIVVLDRASAIDMALESAGKNDFVVVAGKGHETYQVFGDRTEHFSDAETVENWIRRHA